jgi:hypothetical protein
VTGVTEEDDTSYFEIVGDERDFVGTTFVSGGFANPAHVRHMGAFNSYPVPPDNTGLTSLSCAGNTISISIVGDGLDLKKAGLEKGDQIIISDPDGNISKRLKVKSFSETSVTFDGNPLTFSGVGSTLTFLPNRTLEAVSHVVKAFNFKRKTTFRGFYVKTPSEGLVDVLLYTEHNLVRLRNCVLQDSTQQSILLNAVRNGIFAAADNLGEFLTPQFTPGNFQLPQQTVNELSVIYPLTLIGGAMGGYIDSVSEFTGTGAVLFGQLNTGLFGACESHLRLNQATFAHVGSLAAIVLGLNSFCGMPNAQIINNPAATPAGVGVLTLDRGAVFAHNSFLQNLANGFLNTNGSFVDQADATYTDVTAPVVDVGFSNHV